MWLAIDQDLRRAGKGGLADLNRALFVAMRSGEPLSEAIFFRLAREIGASPALTARIMTLAGGNSSDALEALGALGQVANQSLELE